jgi:hypothetical protein
MILNLHVLKLRKGKGLKKEYKLRIARSIARRNRKKPLRFNLSIF